MVYSVVAALFYPTGFVWVYPSFFSSSMTFCLKSPCIMISPSLALPPTPHLLFSIRPSSFPVNPVIRVTTFPPRFLRSSCTRRRCCAGGKVCSSMFSSISYWKSGLVEYTTLSRSFQSFFFIICLIYRICVCLFLDFDRQK